MGSKPSIISFFTSICLVLALLSCDKIFIIRPDYDIIEFELKIKNSSGHDIRIEAFYEKKLYDNLLIKNKSELVKLVSRNYSEDPSKRPNTWNLFSGDGLRDSVAVFFSEKKVLIQKCPSDDGSDCVYEKKTLIHMNSTQNVVEGYCSKKAKKCFGKILVEFTPDDYARAIPIENLKKN